MTMQVSIELWPHFYRNCCMKLDCLYFSSVSITSIDTENQCATWLSQQGPVLLKRHVRQSKYEPLVDRVHLLEANPQYAHIRFPNGRESTVSLRDGIKKSLRTQFWGASRAALRVCKIRCVRDSSSA